MTLETLPRKYTGVEDGKPDTKEAIAYRDFLKKATKLDMNRTIQSLNEDEFNTLIKKMENYEGWHPWPEGEEYIPIQKIIGVKMSQSQSHQLFGSKSPREAMVNKRRSYQFSGKSTITSCCCT